MDIRKYFSVKSVDVDIEKKPIIKYLDENKRSWVIQGNLPKNIIDLYNFESLWNLHPEEYGQIKIFNKLINTPRWQQTYCKDYWYSGMLHEALLLPEEFQIFYDWINTLDMGLYSGKFNQLLINWYRDGNHYIGKHSDNESQIVKDSPIMSISLGSKRKFIIRDKKTSDIVLDLEMVNNSYLIMCGEMQKNYTHEVPKDKKIKDRRINITMRQFKV
jgi:alkylated DNA repair dioxygenase AlkB